MDISKDYQRSILQQNTVAFAGAEGAFASQAAGLVVFGRCRFEGRGCVAPKHVILFA